MKELTMYQGALPKMTTQEPEMIKLPGLGLQAGQESANRAAQLIDVAEEAFKHIKDYGTAKAAEKMAGDATSWYDEEVRRRSELEHGHPESLWNEDGTLKQEELAELKRQYEERISNIQPRFMDSRRGFETHQQLRQLMDKTGERNEAYVHGMELGKARQNWEENYELAVAKDRFSEAVGLLNEGVCNGVLSSQKAELMKLRLLKANTRKAAGGGMLSDSMVEGMLEQEEEKHEERVQFGGDEDLRVHVAQPGVDEQDVMQADMREYVLPNDDGSMRVRIAEPKVETKTERGTDYLSLLQEDLDAGIDVWSRSEALMVGAQQMNADEFAHLMRMDSIEASTIKCSKGSDGKFSVEQNESAPSAMQVCVANAANKGGLAIDEYRTACYAVGAEIIDSELYADAKEKDLKEYLAASMKVYGMENELFADEENPTLAYEAFLNGIVENLMSTRKDDVNKRVDAMLNGAEGRPGLKKLLAGYDDASIAAQYVPDTQVKALKDAQDSWWKSKREETGGSYGVLYQRYKRQFMAEEGIDADKAISPGNVIDEFRDWFFKKDGVYEGLVKDYVESAKGHMRQKAIEAVVDYRRGGGTEWAGEQAAMEEALIKARDELKGGGEWTAWREDRQKSLAARAAKYRIEAEEYKPKLKAAQADGERRRSEDEAQAERAKWEAQQETNAQHKQWSDEKKAAEEKQTPYKRPVVGRIRVVPDKDKREVVTVPVEQYHAICEQLGVSMQEGVVCTFGGSNVQYCVQAGNVKAPQMSTKVFNRLYKGKKLTQEQMRKMVNGHNVQMKFKKVFNIQ